MIFILGALINRIRGGWATDIARKYKWIKPEEEIPNVKAFNDIVYALIFSWLIGLKLQYSDLAVLGVLFLSMWTGRSMGWGGYISSIVDKKIDHNRDDVKLLDKWFRGNDEPVLSGWAALSLRGFIWSTCLYLGFLVIKHLGYEISSSFYYIPLLGLSMGTCYLAMTLLAEKLTFRGNGWQWGELLFGAILWQGIACLI